MRQFCAAKSFSRSTSARTETISANLRLRRNHVRTPVPPSSRRQRHKLVLRWRFRFEEGAMKLSHGFRHVVIFDYKPHVDLRSSLRNHVHINPGGGDDFEDPGGNSDAAANVLADQADNRFVVLRFYLAKVLKIMQQQM